MWKTKLNLRQACGDRKNLWRLVLLFLTIVIAVGSITQVEARSRAYSNRIEPDVDRPGRDYLHFTLNTADPQRCLSRCTADSRCRAWTYVEPGVQSSKAVCWLKSSIPQPRVNRKTVSGFINPLWKVQVCRRIGNIEGAGNVTCEGEDGRNFGKAGRGFLKGDQVWILMRFKRFPLGSKTYSAIYSRQGSDGRYYNFSNNKREWKQTNTSSGWAIWFPASYRDNGNWQVKIAVRGADLPGQILGEAEYNVGGPFE